MTIVSKLLLSTALVLAMSPAARAADLAVEELTAPVEPVVVETSGGFYLGSVSTLTFLDHTSFGTAGPGVATDYDLGYYTALRAGYAFGNMGYVSPRLELEVGYGNASVDHHRVGGVDVGSTDSFGDATTIQGYLNGYIDIPLAADGSAMSAVTPYIGGGVGLMNLNLSRQGVSATGVVIDDDDTRFAYHLDAGVGIDLQSIGMFSDMALFQGTTLDIGYRYTAADDFNFTARDGTSSSTDFKSHAIMVGFRKQF